MDRCPLIRTCISGFIRIAGNSSPWRQCHQLHEVSPVQGQIDNLLVLYALADGSLLSLKESRGGGNLDVLSDFSHLHSNVHNTDLPDRQGDVRHGGGAETRSADGEGITANGQGRNPVPPGFVGGGSSLDPCGDVPGQMVAPTTMAPLGSVTVPTNPASWLQEVWSKNKNMTAIARMLPNETCILSLEFRKPVLSVLPIWPPWLHFR